MFATFQHPGWFTRTTRKSRNHHLLGDHDAAVRQGDTKKHRARLVRALHDSAEDVAVTDLAGDTGRCHHVCRGPAQRVGRDEGRSTPSRCSRQGRPAWRRFARFGTHARLSPVLPLEMALRLVVTVVCIAGCSGCLDSASSPTAATSTPQTTPTVSATQPPATTPPHKRRSHVHIAHAALMLGEGRTRKNFVTRYPGGTFALHASAPSDARFYVLITNGEPETLLGRFLTFSAHRCPTHGRRIVCRAGPFESIPPTLKPWTVWVIKESRPPARITVRLTFRR